MEKEIKIKLTTHADVKIAQRNIPIQLIRSVVTNPDKLEVDKFDRNLTHYIKKVDQKFLRVITKLEKDKTIVVISAFYDRRLKIKRGL